MIVVQISIPMVTQLFRRSAKSLRTKTSVRENQPKDGAQMANDADIIQQGWEAVARGDWDALIADYVENMVFVMPGQNDVLKGRDAFRDALNNLGSALPPGFEITSLRQIGEVGEIVSIVEWKSDKVSEGSQLSVLFKLTGGKITEERWFVDTEQWKAAF
ncbi:MAG: ketosteroid isomerase-like protein [Gammaproteobacteria bacterium]|jgi:ketosteroid isomerase-like protein